jgi:PKD repeat protein
MNFVLNGQSVGSRRPYQGLPNHINNYTKPLMPAVSKTIACQTVNFAVPTPTFAGGCTANTYPINSYLWDFGDPATGSANSSTVTNPSHLFSALGTYTVKTILYSNCTNDTLVSTVNITTLSPVVSILGNTLVCKGDKRIYTATGANSYVWSTSATTASVSLSPSVTTVYTVTGTTNGCKTSKEYTLTVEPCTGISMIDKTSGINLFPNPFTNELSIEVAVATEIVIIDIAGRIVLNTNIQKGLSTINTSDLKPGLYFVQCSTDGSVSRFRIVKGE